jgi:hypothetical protein
MVRLTRVPRSAVAYMRQFVIFAPFSVTEVPLLLAWLSLMQEFAGRAQRSAL